MFGVACLVAASVVQTASAADQATLVADLPASVRAATWCADDEPAFATRRDFAGFLFFAVRCPGNNQNYVQALVVADDESGTGARLLVFPTPYPPNPAAPYDALSNIRWHAGGVVSEYRVDPEETDGPCRHEARWRLVGTWPDAVLISWRENRSCDGEGGWTTVVGK